MISHDRPRVGWEQVGIHVLLPGIGIRPGQPLEEAPGGILDRVGEPVLNHRQCGHAGIDRRVDQTRACVVILRLKSAGLPDPSFTSDSLTAAVFDVPSVMPASETVKLLFTCCGGILQSTAAKCMGDIDMIPVNGGRLPVLGWFFPEAARSADAPCCRRN